MEENWEVEQRNGESEHLDDGRGGALLLGQGQTHYRQSSLLLNSAAVSSAWHHPYPGPCVHQDSIFVSNVLSGSGGERDDAWEEETAWKQLCFWVCVDRDAIFPGVYLLFRIFCLAGCRCVYVGGEKEETDRRPWAR